MVIEVSKPSGWPASASSALALLRIALRREVLQIGVAPVPLRDHAAENWRRLPEERAGDDRLAVDGVRDRLADLGIVERRLGVVRQQPVVARALDRLADQIRVGLDGRPVLGRDLVREVDHARHDRVGQRRDVGDDPVLHGIEVGLAFLVVVRVALELDRGARLVADELEGAASDRLGIQVMARFHQLLRHDRGAGKRHVDQERPGALAEPEAHGQRIDDLDRLDGLDLRAVGIAGIRLAQPVEREFDVLGGERIAVVEGDAVAQLEGVGEAVLATSRRIRRGPGSAARPDRAA